MTEIAAQPARVGPLRRLYNWVLRNAEGPHAWAMLAVVAFAEASFFPIPPDVMVIPMVLADRRRAFQIAAWCTLWSVVGGLLGYAIGHFLYDSIGHWIVSAADMKSFRTTFAVHSYWLLFQGFTPIPFKLVTIASGFAGLSLPLFLLYISITRGLRFTVEASVLYIFGEEVRTLIEKWLEWALVGMLALIVIGYFIVHHFF